MPASTSAMNTGAFAQLISRDFTNVFFDNYTRQDTEYDKVGNVSTMDGAYIREGQMAGLQALQGVNEGEPVAYDGFIQGNEKTVMPSDFALGVAITRNMYDDDRTGYMKKAFAELGKAAAYTRELKFWDLLNSGFVTTTRVGIDGAALFSSHTLIGGGTYANYAATNSSLSMTTLQAMCDRFELLPNERGIPPQGQAQAPHRVAPEQVEGRAARQGRVQPREREQRAELREHQEPPVHGVPLPVLDHGLVPRGGQGGP